MKTDDGWEWRERGGEKRKRGTRRRRRETERGKVWSPFSARERNVGFFFVNVVLTGGESEGTAG